ncbi:MAG: efflux RND transporter periplasmic adaptor subunit, partial [Acidobacteria bacterium]|nr:efflux RND transporter periplasmic adaptor subunit [Acidobacteriota bacterium]
SMTLRAKSSGYVAIQQNVNSNFMYPGMRLPMLQVGDTVRAGMAVAQIPDLKSWEASARIGELDRGHLAVDQKAEFRLVAMPGRQFTGRVKNLGSTAGPPWDRHFDCRLTLDDPSPELRQGMTANVVITTEVRRNVLWAPAQALFESDGRTYVYLASAAGFVPTDVKLERRSESQVVLSGVKEGQAVALASPDQQSQKKTPAGNAMQALPK